MHSSSFWKKTPVKVISAIVLFLVFVGLISFALEKPFTKIYSNSNNYDVAFVGASETMWGINPEVVDENLDSKSYLLATSNNTIEGRYETLKAALQQESLKTVVIEISYFGLTNTFNKNVALDKRVLFYSRISGLNNRLDTAFSAFDFWDDEYDKLYAEMIYEGINSWKTILGGSYSEIASRRGYEPQAQMLKSLSKKQAAKLKNSESLSSEYKLSKKYAEKFKELVEFCKSKGATVILVTNPVSEQLLWKNTGWQKANNMISKIAEECDVPYFDFNLLKDRTDYFSDDTTYRDEEHLDDEGATIYSRMMADVIKSVTDGSELPYEFYDTYSEAKKHLSYAEY